MPSESSSPDEQIHKWKACVDCGHPQHSTRCGEEHPPAGDLPGRKCGCLQVTSREDIANTCRPWGGCAEHPADAETLRQKVGRLDAADAVQRAVAETAGEPEAPECAHIGSRVLRDGRLGENWTEFECPDCGAEWRRDWGKGVGIAPEPEAPAPPRPPILVAYATGSGDLNELALPGDVTAAVVDGSLVISHASGVLGIVRVKPMELEN